VETLYYKYGGKRYAVPTHGKIMKIIDFGRSIYTFNGNTFTSNCFAPDGDAYTQYNTEPYYNSRKPRVENNYAFDLCRLGTSIYDFVFDEDDDETNEMDAFQSLINEWCLDDNNKNVLYKKNGDERYPQFKLYKMIARTVSRHLPENQLSKFDAFLWQEKDEFPVAVWDDVENGSKQLEEQEEGRHLPWMDVDAMPSFQKPLL
jgi:hypothetical protein